MVYLVSSDMYALIKYVSFVNWMAIGLSVVVLLYFRKTRPDMKRPIKVRTFPYLYKMFWSFQFSIWFLYSAGTRLNFQYRVMILLWKTIKSVCFVC